MARATRKTVTATTTEQMDESTPVVETTALSLNDNLLPSINIQQLIDEGHSKSTILGLLMYSEKLSRKDAIAKIEQYTIKDKKNDMEAIVKYVIDNIGDKNKTRRDIAVEMEAAGLCKESTAFHYLSLLPFVIEYHKQMTK